MFLKQRIKWWQIVKAIISIASGALISFVIINQIETDKLAGLLLWIDYGLIALVVVFTRMVWSLINSLAPLFEILNRREARDLVDIQNYLNRKVKASVVFCIGLSIYLEIGKTAFENDIFFIISLGGIAGLMILKNIQLIENYLDLTAFKSKKQAEMAIAKRNDATLKRMKD